MGSVSVILLFGWCYELFEIKYLFIASVLLFEIGSAVCASAPTMNAMIVGRVVSFSKRCFWYTKLIIDRSLVLEDLECT